jgi:hypothetical protein
MKIARIWTSTMLERRWWYLYFHEEVKSWDSIQPAALLNWMKWAHLSTWAWHGIFNWMHRQNSLFLGVGGRRFVTCKGWSQDLSNMTLISLLNSPTCCLSSHLYSLRPLFQSRCENMEESNEASMSTLITTRPVHPLLHRKERRCWQATLVITVPPLATSSGILMKAYNFFFHLHQILIATKGYVVC